MTEPLNEPSLGSLQPPADAGTPGSSSSINGLVPLRCAACGDLLTVRPSTDANMRTVEGLSVGRRQPEMHRALHYLVPLAIVLAVCAAGYLMRLIWLIFGAFGLFITDLITDSSGRAILAAIFVGFAGCGCIALALGNYCRELWLSRQSTFSSSATMARAHDWLWTAIAIYALLRIGLEVLSYAMLLQYLNLFG